MKRIDENQRVKLLKYTVKHRESLFCRRLENRVIQCQFQEKKCMNIISMLSCVLKFYRYQSRPSTHKRLQKAKAQRWRGKRRWWNGSSTGFFKEGHKASLWQRTLFSQKFYFFDLLRVEREGQLVNYAWPIYLICWCQWIRSNWLREPWSSKSSTGCWSL